MPSQKQAAGTPEELQAENLRLREYVFGMETALRGARASGTASETSMWASECAELRFQNSDIKERYATLLARLRSLEGRNEELGKALREAVGMLKETKWAQHHCQCDVDSKLPIGSPGCPCVDFITPLSALLAPAPTKE